MFAPPHHRTSCPSRSLPSPPYRWHNWLVSTLLDMLPCEARAAQPQPAMAVSLAEATDTHAVKATVPAS